jgi:tetratricopeptide (TPR) repeat protein
MPDTLDLQALVKLGDSYRSETRRRRQNAALLFFIGLITILLFRADSASLGGLYRLENGQWQAVNLPFSGVPVTLKTSKGGAVWVATTVYPGLYRYQNGAWDMQHAFQSRNEAYLEAFDLHNEDAWAVAGRDIYHWDGSTWSRYANIFEAARNAAISAGSYGVIAVDDTGTIAHYRNGGWSIQPISVTLPNYRGMQYASPELLEAPSGDVYLSYYGLWRYRDSEGWSLVRAMTVASQQYRLMGATDDALWVVENGAYKTLDFRTDAWKDSSFAQIGVMRSISQFVGYGGKTYAVGGDLRVNDGGNWSYFPAAFPNRQWITASLAFDAGGQAWAAQYSPEISDQSFIGVFTVRSVIFNGLGPLIICILPVIILLFSGTRASLRRLETSRKILYEALPGIQHYIPPQTKTEGLFKRWRLAFFGVIGLVLLITAQSGIWWVGMIAGMVLYVLWLILPSLMRLHDKTVDEATKAHIRRYLPLNIAIWSYLAALTGVLIPLSFGLASNIISDTLFAGAVAYGIAFIAAMFLFYTTLLLPVFSIYLGPLARGDYETALHRVDRWMRLMPTYISFTIAKGVVLLSTPRDEESEAMWRKIVTETQNGGWGYHLIGLVNLAAALARQDKDEEALNLLCAAAEIMPESEIAYRELTYHHFASGNDPARTLAMSEAMMHFARQPRFPFPLVRVGWGQTLAVRALALAASGNAAEASTFMERAFAETRRSYLPGLAWLHSVAGRVAEVGKDTDTARKQYRQAIDLDPQGATGRDAQERLSALEHS